jgi:spermidine synthase
VYEVFWQRYLATLLGSHSEATAAVLAIFLGGLSCGYALFGNVARAIARRGDPATSAARELFAYGIVEAAIGLYAFAFPWLFAVARALSLHGPRGSETAAFAIDVVISALLIGPPTVLMGGTIPLLTQGLATGVADATRFHALVYATNTLGAFFGAVIGGFFLLPWLGLQAGVVAMGAINLAAGLTFMALGAAHGGAAVTAQPSAQAQATSTASFELGAYAVVALLGGFAMMALQTTMNRIGALSFGASYFTFATVVAAFVLCIALGSMAVSMASRIPPAVLVVTQWLLVAYLVVLYHSVGNAPYWAHVLRTLFRDTPASFYPYYLSVLAGIVVVLFVPLALSGAMLPLLFHHLRGEVDDLGAVAGRLYSWNTVGSLLGALFAGYLFLFWLDLHHIYRLAVVALAARRRNPERQDTPAWSARGGVGLVLALAAIALQPAWARERLSSGLFGMRAPMPVSYAGPEAFFNTYVTAATTPECVFYDDDPVTSVAVLKARGGGEPDLSIIVNGKSDGDLVGDNVTMRLLALIPAMLTDARKDAFIVGFGTGVTAGELAAQPSVEKITIAGDRSRRHRGRSQLRALQRRCAERSQGRDRTQRRVSRAAAQRRHVRPHHLGAEQSLGDGSRDAVREGVPRGRTATAASGRGLRAVVPHVLDVVVHFGARDEYLPSGVPAHLGLVHGQERHRPHRLCRC